MKAKQVFHRLHLVIMFLVVAVFATGGMCQAADGGPYHALSQDGSTVVGRIEIQDGQWQALRLQNGVSTALGTLGGDWSYASAVSADGAVVVGSADTADNIRHAFRWADNSMTDLGTLGGDSSSANAVSADGTVVVGDSRTASGEQHAFRWADNSMTDLGTLGGSYSSANAVSADGAVVVGSAVTADSYSHAFRWADNSMTDLGTLGGYSSYANGVSADGAVVVGDSRTDSGEQHAFRWADNSMTDLGTLGGSYSSARAVSADGAVVVGSAVTADSYSHAFRWADNSMTDLGTLGGSSSSANAVSADGSTVVGAAATETDWVAFRWTESSGMQSVAEWLGDNDVSLAGWNLQSARGVSSDGSVLIGTGYDPDGNFTSWMARQGALIDPAQWLGTVSGARQVFHTGTQLSTLALYGAHHRPLMSYDQVGQGLGCWVTGDLGSFDDDPDLISGSTEIGVYNDYADGRLRVGLGLGYSMQRQDLPLAGSADLDGGYLVGEFNWRPETDANLIASVTAIYGLWDAKVKRGYLNGAAVDHSTGDTDVQSAAIRLKVDWQDAARLGPVRFDPYAGLTFTHTSVDSYTEKSGSVPAKFDEQRHDAQELRIGVAGVMSLSEALRLRLTIEGIRRFDDRGPALSGQDMGGFGISFDVAGDDIRNNWVRCGAEVDYTINDSSMIAMSLNGASQGQDPDISGAISYRKRF